MIVGTGVDLVDIPRFERTLARTPRLLPRLFTASEQVLAPHSLAARYAAKEALIKALGGSDGVHWAEIEITSDPEGKPGFALTGATAASVAARGIRALHLTMSHDAGLAIAYVVAEAGSQTSEDATDLGAHRGNRPNLVGSSEFRDGGSAPAPDAAAHPGARA